MKRPTTFKDWRALWHHARAMVGDWARINFDGRRIVIDRHLWKALNRERRIKARLDIECEVKDTSFAKALLELVRDHESRKGQ